jgi:hypothetical protein
MVHTFLLTKRKNHSSIKIANNNNGNNPLSIIFYYNLQLETYNIELCEIWVHLWLYYNWKGDFHVL